MLQHNWSLWFASLLVTIAGCRTEPPPPSPQATEPTFDAPATSPATSWLHDVTQSWGLDFTQQAGDFDDWELPSIMGSGAAAIDYDRDGQTDLYLVNGQPAAALLDDRGDRLFRQQQPGRLVDVSRHTGIRCGEFGMGAWWGDYDADGFADLLLTNVGTNRLFRNLGDGTFDEVLLPAGVADAAWTTAACWSDVDGDADLDLLLVNYVDYVPGQFCDGSDGRQDFCGPSVYQGTVDRLLINTGTHAADAAERFIDETVPRGLGDLRGKGLGALAQDLNGDGRVDFYVANDMEPNRLWIQRPDGRFEDRADLSGVSRNFLGETEASMGIVSGDWNDDLQPDLFMTHLSGETNTLYLSTGAEIWQDGTPPLRLGPPSLAATGFGIGAIDFEQDGDVDFLIANGGVKRGTAQTDCSPEQACYAQPNAVYLYDTQTHGFDLLPDVADEFTGPQEISRGLVCADLDRDGDLDVLLTNCEGPARLYENVAPDPGDWLALRLVDTVGHREAVGAVVRVRNGAAPVMTRYANPYQGYLSCSDGTVHFGLGRSAADVSVEVIWPDGARETFDNLPPNQSRTLVRSVGPFDRHESQETASDAPEAPSP